MSPDDEYWSWDPEFRRAISDETEKDFAEAHTKRVARMRVAALEAGRSRRDDSVGAPDAALKLRLVDEAVERIERQIENAVKAQERRNYRFAADATPVVCTEADLRLILAALEALAATTGTAKTAKQAECEASQSGAKRNAQDQSTSPFKSEGN